MVVSRYTRLSSIQPNNTNLLKRALFIAILSILVISPTQSHAAWWKPSDWFKPTPYVQPAAVVVPTKPEPVVTPEPVIIKRVVEKIIDRPVDRVITKTVTVQDQSLQGKVDLLTKENASLKAQLGTGQSALTEQLNMCRKELNDPTLPLQLIYKSNLPQDKACSDAQAEVTLSSNSLNALQKWYDTEYEKIDSQSGVMVSVRDAQLLTLKNDLTSSKSKWTNQRDAALKTIAMYCK